MLSVFQKSVAECPAELAAPQASGSEAGKDLKECWQKGVPDAVTVQISEEDYICYSLSQQNPVRPRSFACLDNIFCLFEGMLENVAQLRQQYGLPKCISEVNLVIEIYRALRDRAPYPADQAVSDLRGGFYFVLLDNTSKTIFAAADTQGKVPLFWGKTGTGSMAFSNDGHLLKEGCNLNFAPFPKGCFFTSMGGLRSFEQPNTPLRAVQHVDSEGQICGSTFKPEQTKKLEHRLSIKHVGSNQQMYWAPEPTV